MATNKQDAEDSMIIHPKSLERLEKIGVEKLQEALDRSDEERRIKRVKNADDDYWYGYAMTDPRDMIAEDEQKLKDAVEKQTGRKATVNGCILPPMPDGTIGSIHTPVAKTPDEFVMPITNQRIPSRTVQGDELMPPPKAAKRHTVKLVDQNGVEQEVYIGPPGDEFHVVEYRDGKFVNVDATKNVAAEIEKLSKAAQETGEAVVVAGQAIDSIREPLSESELGDAEFYEEMIEASLDSLHKIDPKRKEYFISCRPTPADRVLDHLKDRFTGWDISIIAEDDRNGLLFIPR